MEIKRFADRENDFDLKLDGDEPEVVSAACREEIITLIESGSLDFDRLVTLSLAASQASSEADQDKIEITGFTLDDLGFVKTALVNFRSLPRIQTFMEKSAGRSGVIYNKEIEERMILADMATDLINSLDKIQR